MTSVPQQNQSSGVNVLPLIVFGVLSLIFGYFIWAILPSMGILPEAASEEAIRTDALFRILMGIGGVVFFLVQGLIYYAAIVFRAKPGDTSDGPNIHGNVMLEIVWTVVPSLIVIFLAISSYRVWIDNRVEPENPNMMMTVDSDGNNVAINAIGQRYNWSFQYTTNDFADVINDDESIVENAGNRIVINTGDLYIYAGQQVDMNMNSLDVIHSFWAPEMRIKQDLLPGRTTNVRFRPQLPETAERWENVMLLTPVTVYSEANLNADVLLDYPLEEGALPEPVELTLVETLDDLTGDEIDIASTDLESANPESGLAWVRVVNERGVEGFILITADTPLARFNRYRLLCTELCGGGHGNMYTDIVMLESQEAFMDTWYIPTVNLLSVPAGNPFEVGDQVIDAYPCKSCHVLSDRDIWIGAIGPALDGIGGRASVLADSAGEATGNEVTSGAEYIAQSIRLSQDYHVPGYAGIAMPYFHPGTDIAQNQMSQEDLIGIVAYLCTQTGTGNAADSDCGLVNWEFDENGEFTGDVDALVAELTAITDEYED